MRIRLRRLPWATYVLAAVLFAVLILSGCGPRTSKGHPAPADCSLTGTYGFAWSSYTPAGDWWRQNFKAAGTWQEWADSTAWAAADFPGVWSASRMTSGVRVVFEPDSEEYTTAKWNLIPDLRKACQWFDPGKYKVEDGKQWQWIFTLVDRSTASWLRKARDALETK